jgi:methyltransferase (TIGR00027 family)
MAEPAPSVTAQRAAAYRLRCRRVETPHGDPDADERLARDVTASLGFTPESRMARYLQARTAFFDRVVVNALERGVIQVAAIGAGYDARSLRYRRTGVRWFEIDHPATQADKRRRLERLQIDAHDVTFVALDLADGGTDGALLDAGWEPDVPSLFLCEGVAFYLEVQVFEGLLRDLRAVAGIATRLAFSIMPPVSEPARVARRARLCAVVEALGEPALNGLTSGDVDALLGAACWRMDEASSSSPRAGLIVAAPKRRPEAGT